MDFVIRLTCVCVRRGKKELKAKQAKASMDSVKSVSVDKTIKNKAERDRYYTQ